MVKASGKNNLIFIHLPRTGGSSVRSVLLREKCRFVSTGVTHQSSREWINRLGNSTFRKAMKFTIVRNPYDRIVSYYYHRQREKAQDPNHPIHNLSFSAYVHWLSSRQPKESLERQWGKISIDGFHAVDFIIKFETLEYDWSILASQQGLPSELPHLNASKRCRDWQQYYDQKTADTLYEFYHQDFEKLQYPRWSKRLFKKPPRHLRSTFVKGAKLWRPLKSLNQKK